MINLIRLGITSVWLSIAFILGWTSFGIGYIAGEFSLLGIMCAPAGHPIKDDYERVRKIRAGEPDPRDEENDDS